MSTIQASTSATAAGTVTIGASINTTTSPSRSQSSLRQARRPPSNRSAPVARSSTSTARRNPDPRARQSPPQFAPVASSRTMRQTLEPRARVLWNSESRTRPQQSRQSPLESAPVASSSTAQQTPGRFPHWDRWLGRRPTSRR
jgi:hypothetical protein